MSKSKQWGGKDVRILVTGVTGVVGRSVARQLVAAGHQVSGIAARPHRNLDRDVEFVCAGLRGPALRALADEADLVVHLAPVETGVPGSAGIDGVVHVTHAAARAGARLVFVSQAAGPPRLYRQAEELVSTGWAPSLIVRLAPLVGRQLDWLVCRTAATLLARKMAPQPMRVVHLDDLVRFLLLAVGSTHTGVVDLASPDTVTTVFARRLLQAVDPRRRAHRIRPWIQLTPKMDTSALQRDWKFDFGWSAAEAVADTARGLAGRRLGSNGAVTLPGHLALPLEAVPRSEPTDGTSLRCAAPEGLEGEFDDRIDPHFPVFSAAGLTDTLPGTLTPMTLDVQLAGLRTASSVIAQAMGTGGVAAEEWGSRAIAVFGHRAYVGVSSSVAAAAQLPGWNEQAVVKEAFGDRSRVADLFPLGRPPLPEGPLGLAAKAITMARALAIVRHLKASTRAYHDAAIAERLDAGQLRSLPDARLEVRIGLLRDRIHQGWALTALWLVDTGITAAALARTGTAVWGIAAVMTSERVAAETAPLAVALRRDPQSCALACGGDLDGVRARSKAVSSVIDTVVTRIAHRGPAEAELASPTFGDSPALLLIAAGHAATTATGPEPAAQSMAQRMAAHARDSRELAHDVTMRFTHELRKALRELGSRRVSAELIDFADDVFYLTCNELLAMPTDARLRIKRRRAERERLQALRLPDVIDLAWTPVTA